MPTPDPHANKTRLDRPTLAWLALMALTLASALASEWGTHALLRLPAALAVAALCAAKARVLVQGYLAPHDAGRTIERIVNLFAMLAPAMLALMAFTEAWRAMAP